MECTLFFPVILNYNEANYSGSECLYFLQLTENKSIIDDNIKKVIFCMQECLIDMSELNIRDCVCVGV